MNVRRFHSPGFTNFEGMLENDDNRDWLSRRFGPDHEFSATQLEAYAHCPFEFFVSQVLEVEPLAETGFETDFGRRGTLVHAVLAQLHRELAAADARPPSRSRSSSAFMNCSMKNWEPSRTNRNSNGHCWRLKSDCYASGARRMPLNGSSTCPASPPESMPAVAHLS